RLVEPLGHFHRDGKDAQEDGEAAGTQTCLPGSGAAHGGIDGTISLGVGLADVEKVRIPQKGTVTDDDPSGPPTGIPGSLDDLPAFEGIALLFLQKIGSVHEAYPFGRGSRLDVYRIALGEEGAVAAREAELALELFNQ